mmetsp:Transcript_8804/g.15493  ORF Transcript_8804/g.15493 Transcript_8804/m.15493 type:complete len:99 (+) Transcript_8804:34-330(+)
MGLVVLVCREYGVVENERGDVASLRSVQGDLLASFRVEVRDHEPEEGGAASPAVEVTVAVDVLLLASEVEKGDALMVDGTDHVGAVLLFAYVKETIAI